MTNAGDLSTVDRSNRQMRECGSCKLSTVDTTRNSVYCGQNGLQRNAPCAAPNDYCRQFYGSRVCDVLIFNEVSTGDR